MVFYKCNPVVDIWFFNGLFKSFRVASPGAQEGEVAGGKTWYICDLNLVQEQKMSKE